MTLLEIIILIGLVGIALISLALAVCGIKLWKAVWRIIDKLDKE